MNVRKNGLDDTLFFRAIWRQLQGAQFWEQFVINEADEISVPRRHTF